MDLLGLTLLTATTDTASTDTTSSAIMMFLPMILLLVFFYFFLLRPQKKQEKQTEEMRKNIQIGDEIETIGGIVGIVIRQSEDTVVIETGGEKNKLRIKKWAIKENLTQHEENKTAMQSQIEDKIKEKEKEKEQAKKKSK